MSQKKRPGRQIKLDGGRGARVQGEVAIFGRWEEKASLRRWGVNKDRKEVRKRVVKTGEGTENRPRKLPSAKIPRRGWGVGGLRNSKEAGAE